jgi:mono/diheme cytochrome c family protein
MGSELYRVNCAVCHGAGGEGDGPMRKRMEESGYRGFPADLTSTGPTSTKSDGEVFQIISQGFAGAYGMPPESFLMPPFRKLLTSDERWMIIQYIRDTFQK